jgi:ribosomal protein S12 methylthiotransferase
MTKTPAAQKNAPKIGFVSLGCPKALVDSERIMTQLKAEGYQFSPTHEGSDVVIVNTCGFLDSARDESLQAIGDAMAANGKVIVTGCLGAKPEVIREKFPNVLSITGPAKYESVLEAVHKAVPPQHDPYLDLIPAAGVKLTPKHYAYLKISEGCNNRCTFCIIPSLRGDLVSRPLADVMKEAENLVKSGVKELLVISQDTSAYGVDMKYAENTKFLTLCEELGKLGVWVRLHYVYPYPHVDQAIELMTQGKILPYLDIPFQHASEKVLKAMKRPASSEKVLERIKTWRKICPDIAIRSSFVVGFPGETQEDFEELLYWLDEAQLDRVGCFKYEAVEGAEANKLGNLVPEEVKQERWNKLMELQQRISMKKLKKYIGKTLDVLVDEVDAGGIVGRSKYDAPEIDGAVILSSSIPLVPGQIVKAKITESDEYDLYGSVV